MVKIGPTCYQQGVLNKVAVYSYVFRFYFVGFLPFCQCLVIHLRSMFDVPLFLICSHWFQSGNQFCRLRPVPSAYRLLAHPFCSTTCVLLPDWFSLYFSSKFCLWSFSYMFGMLVNTFCLVVVVFSNDFVIQHMPVGVSCFFCIWVHLPHTIMTICTYWPRSKHWYLQESTSSFLSYLQSIVRFQSSPPTLHSSTVAACLATWAQESLTSVATLLILCATIVEWTSHFGQNGWIPCHHPTEIKNSPLQFTPSFLTD